MIYALIVTRIPHSYCWRKMKVGRALTAITDKYGLRHQRLDEATKAAKAISKHPLVAHVTMIRVHEAAEGVWRNGRKS